MLFVNLGQFVEVLRFAVMWIRYDTNNGSFVRVVADRLEAFFSLELYIFFVLWYLLDLLVTVGVFLVQNFFNLLVHNYCRITLFC